MKDVKILGIGGTDASGKDTLGELMAERHGWLFISVTDLLRAEVTKRGMVLERPTLRSISAEWRRSKGPSVLVDKAMKEFEAVEKKYQGLVIASLRHPAEADRVHQLGGKVIWVDADPEVRYRRIVVRNRGSEDQVTFEEFLAEERSQMQHSGDEATLSLEGVKAKADVFLENNGDDIDAFKNEVNKALEDL
ncbi:AAA family ATPase [Candidatus Saccharibacteria bacterium]|nr:AAA family ATPase [Candidatus Saccharibacteria bacterium]